MKLRHRTANHHPQPRKQGQHTPEDHHRLPPTVVLPQPHQHLAAPTQQAPAPQRRGHQPHQHRRNHHPPPKQLLRMNDDYTSPWPHLMTSISSQHYNRNACSSKPHRNSSEVESGKHSPTPYTTSTQHLRSKGKAELGNFGSYSPGCYSIGHPVCARLAKMTGALGLSNSSRDNGSNYSPGHITRPKPSPPTAPPIQPSNVKPPEPANSFI